MSLSAFKQNSIAAAVALAVGAMFTAAAPTANAWVSPEPHVFSIDDIQGGFDGSTYGSAGAVQDTTIICGLTTSMPRRRGTADLDKEGVTVYPIDSEFGFYIVDFLGAAQKYRDDNYLEGWAGNFYGRRRPWRRQGLQARPPTPTRSRPPYGTWCRGLGGNSVKCETEHYTVMEHVLSCHEVIPYLYADPVLGHPGGAVLPRPDPARLPQRAAVRTAGPEHLRLRPGGSGRCPVRGPGRTWSPTSCSTSNQSVVTAARSTPTTSPRCWTTTR